MTERSTPTSNSDLVDKALGNKDKENLQGVLSAADEIAKRLLRAEQNAEEAKRRAEEERRLREEAEHKVDLDPKTQLLNFPAFQRIASEKIAKGEIPENRKPFYSLIIGDLDDFKLLNTRLGYQQTDRSALLPVANIFRESASRQGDEISEVSRFGGEEFLVLLEGTDQEGAKIVAERIQNKINQLHPMSPDKPLGISMGIITFSPGSDFEEMMTCSNKAVDVAKKIDGKNQIVAYEDLSPGDLAE